MSTGLRRLKDGMVNTCFGPQCFLMRFPGIRKTSRNPKREKTSLPRTMFYSPSPSRPFRTGGVVGSLKELIGGSSPFKLGLGGPCKRGLEGQKA